MSLSFFDPRKVGPFFGLCGLVPLNLRLATPNDHFLYLMSRSGLAVRGITVEGGVIDPDYHQEVKAIFRNTTSHPFKVQKGQRIAQAVFCAGEVQSSGQTQ